MLPSRPRRLGRADPPPLDVRAHPVGFPDVRFLGDDEEGLVGFMDSLAPPRSEGSEPTRVLALSGGGAGGAFGAGALVGLSRAGVRPTFHMVTGVSTGALLAPFAFVGSAWDHRLELAYRSGAGELLSLKGLRAGPTLYGPGPLADLVGAYVDDELIAAVGAAYREGRRLFVATANLDSQRMAIWDLSAVAARGGDKAVALFRDVLAASASLPGIFSPRLIDVECDGQLYQEMHIDGGAVLPLFVVPEALMLRRARAWPGSGVEVYALVNTTLQPTARATPMGAMPILMRSFELMLRSSYRGALRSVAAFCEINGFTLRTAALPDHYGAASMLRFDAVRMSALFDDGMTLAQQGKLWAQLS